MSLRAISNAVARRGGPNVRRYVLPPAMLRKTPALAAYLAGKISGGNVQPAMLASLSKAQPGGATLASLFKAHPGWISSGRSGLAANHDVVSQSAISKAIAGGVMGDSCVAGGLAKMGSRGTTGTTKAATARLMSTSAKMGERGTVGATKAATKAGTPRLMWTSAKKPAAGQGPLRNFLAVCAVGGGVAVVLFCISKPDHVANVDDEEDEDLPEFLDLSLFHVFPRVADPMYNNEFCGCCWAVIAIKSIEARFAIQLKKSLKLSIQQVIDCAAIEGCQGNNLDQAYKYILGAGLTTEEAYPGPPARNRSFLHGLLRGYCKMDGKPIVARIEGFQRIKPTEKALKRALQTSAVAVYVNTTRDFEGFNGGYVLDVTYLPPRSEVPGVKHVLLVVGYGKNSDGTKYWKLMNTWGRGWGEGGYVRFRRGCENPLGVAGMFEHPGFLPVILPSNPATN